MKQRTLFNGRSPSAECPLATTTQSSQIGLHRHRFAGGAEIFTSAPAQDAHLIVVQLHDHPAHDFWADGRHAPMPFSGKGSVGIIDLRQEASALFNSEVDSLHIHVPRHALEDLAVDTGSQPIADLVVAGRWEPGDDVVQQISPLLVEAMAASDRPMQAFVDHLVLAMMTHVASTYGGMQPRKILRGSLAPWQVKRAKELLAENLTGEISLLEIAAACGLSVSYFTRAFKTSTGTTPHAWTQACRVDRARSLLADAGLILADIALRCGFADQSHFTRVFRSSTGYGPGAWRRLHNLA